MTGHNGSVSETSSGSRSNKFGLPLPDFVIETLITMVPVTAIVRRSAGWSRGWLIVTPLSLGVLAFWVWLDNRRRAARRRAVTGADGATAGDRQRREAAAMLARTLAAATPGQARQTARTVRGVESVMPAMAIDEPAQTGTPPIAPANGAGHEPGAAAAGRRDARAPAVATGLDDFDPGGATRV